MKLTLLYTSYTCLRSGLSGVFSIKKEQLMYIEYIYTSSNTLIESLVCNYSETLPRTVFTLPTTTMRWSHFYRLEHKTSDVLNEIKRLIIVVQFSIVKSQESLHVPVDAAEVSVVLLQSSHNLLILTLQLPHIVSYGYQQLVVVLLGDIILRQALSVSAGHRRIYDKFCLRRFLHTGVGLSLP